MTKQEMEMIKDSSITNKPLSAKEHSYMAILVIEKHFMFI